MVTPRTLAAWLLATAGMLTVGCGSDRDPRENGVYFACSTASDCLSGYACTCGWCQPKDATPVGCGLLDGGSTADASTDAGAGDGGVSDGGLSDTGDASADAAADTADAGSGDAADSTDSADGSDTADAGSGACSPLTWAGCPAGQGCYFNEDTAKTFCLSHGALGAGQACQPTASTPPCGKGAAGPLLCDVIELKCQPLCRTSAPSCPNQWTCYPLGAKTKWPDDAGVCAP